MSNLAAAATTAPAGLAHEAHAGLGLVSTADPTLASFYGQLWWMILLKVVVLFAFLMVMTLFAIWAERRVIGRMQQRPGPNRAGPAAPGSRVPCHLPRLASSRRAAAASGRPRCTSISSAIRPST